MRALARDIAAIRDTQVYGRVVALQGLMVEVAGPVAAMSVGSRLTIAGSGKRDIPVEVIGFRDERALCMPFGPLEGVRMGASAILAADGAETRPDISWLGRVVDALGRPIDGLGPLRQGAIASR